MALPRLFYDPLSSSGKRAEREAHHYRVLQIDATTFHVLRAGDALRTYDVQIEGRGDRGMCSCHGFTFGFQTLDDRNPCLHLYLVRLHALHGSHHPAKPSKKAAT